MVIEKNASSMTRVPAGSLSVTRTSWIEDPLKVPVATERSLNPRRGETLISSVTSPGRKPTLPGATNMLPI